MRPRLRVLNVPAHPLLVHFPITLWLMVPMLDIAALYSGPEPWWNLAEGATILGVLFGVAAIVTGVLDYLQPAQVGIDLKLAARHGIRTTLAWCMFAVRASTVAFVPPAHWLILSCLVIDLIGCALLVQGVYFGTRQVYQQLDEV